MPEDRTDAAEADEDGGRRNEEFFSAGKPLNTGKKEMPCGKAQGDGRIRVAIISQHTKTIRKDYGF